MSDQGQANVVGEAQGDLEQAQGGVRQEQGDFRRFYGKYRGKVIDNIDPLFLGRILADVSAVPGALLNFAMPCVPYAGLGVGLYAIPPIGANVWIEFEGGDPNYPIWSGCFWSEGEVPLGAPPPETKIFKTELVTVILNDLGGTVEVAAPADVSVDAGGAVQIAAGGDASMSAGGAVEISAGADTSISAAGAAEMTAGGDAAVIAAGAVEVTAGGDTSITGGLAVEISAGADVSVEAIGAIEQTAIGIAITGLTEVTGDLLVDGQQVLFV